jgi:DNA-binding response OmpR family regulator
MIIGGVAMMNARPKKILIIEDNESYLDMLKIRLELNGYHAIAVQDGVDGFNIAREKKPDLIILDLALPNMDNRENNSTSLIDKNMGHKICRMIKFDKNTAHIPVIILTASDMNEDIELAKKCGADVFIMKTSNTEKLLTAIHNLLKDNPSS